MGHFDDCTPDQRFTITPLDMWHETGTTKVIIDWDQRRWFMVKGSTELLPPEGKIEIDIIERYIDHLAPSVHSLTVDNEGLLVSVSSDPNDDATLVTYYPRVCNCPSLRDCSRGQGAPVGNIAGCQ